MTHQREQPTLAERSKPYPHYKESDIEWVGRIPVHWELKRLEFAAAIIAGQSPPSEVVTVFSGRFPFLQGNAEFGSINPMPQLACEGAPKTAHVGDILLSVRAPVGAINIADQTYGIGRGLCAIHPTSDLHSRFTYYLLLAIRDGLSSQATGSTYDAVTVGNVENLMVALPSVQEQRAISTFLDRETAKIDALVAKKERLMKLLQEKRTALITRAVTKGLHPDVRMKDSGIEWLGAIPAHWDLVALRRRWSVVDCKHLTVPFVSEGIPLASVRETQSFELDLKDSHHTTFEWYKTLVEGDRKPRCGDLIYCRNVSVGSASLVAKDDIFAMGQDVCLIRSSAENQRWLNYYLCSSAMSRQLASTLVGSTFDRINVAEIMALLIPVPPRVEQDKTAQFLDLETAKIDTLLAKIRTAIDHLKELRTALLSAAVTGKIDVRDDIDANPRPAP